jgi:hypothetical protein
MLRSVFILVSTLLIVAAGEAHAADPVEIKITDY